MVAEQPQSSRAKVPFQRHVRDGRFYIVYAAAACALVFLGFGPTYYFRLFSSDNSIPAIVHLHSFVFSAWMLLYLAQTILVEKGRVDLHVKLGAIGLALALAIIVIGYMTAVGGARTGYLGPGIPRSTEFSRMFMIVPMRDLVWFGISLALAIYYRNTPETHKRLMLMVFIGGLMPVVLGRVPGPLSAILGFAFMLAPPIYDAFTRRRLHRVYLYGIPLLIVPTFFLEPIAATPAWKSFADWLVG
ncbi:MAG: hypothetical protein QUS14_17485 [Pyrinomonadaceae bacterium]|nr:hypothetical protein [Pyrinomonadaceae bacterium]